MQKGITLAFYSCKMNGAQTANTTGKQELLSTMEALKEFEHPTRTEIEVHTDHMNILYGDLHNDRITNWQQLQKVWARICPHCQKGQSS